MTTITEYEIDAAAGMCRAHGLHGTEAKLRALAAERDALAARLAEAERLRDEAVAALESLERRATVVSNKGAVTGPQWTKLTIGILGARNLLASIKTTRND